MSNSPKEKNNVTPITDKMKDMEVEPKTMKKESPANEDLGFSPSSYITPAPKKNHIMSGVSTMCRAPLRKPPETADSSPMDVDTPETSPDVSMQKDSSTKKT